MLLSELNRTKHKSIMEDKPMTHITISDRIWAVPLPNEVPISDIEVIGNELFYKYGNIKKECVRQLPDYKTYKFLCLASEVINNMLIQNDFMLEHGEEASIQLNMLDKDKEYALIEVE